MFNYTQTSRFAIVNRLRDNSAHFMIVGLIVIAVIMTLAGTHCVVECGAAIASRIR